MYSDDPYQVVQPRQPAPQLTPAQRRQLIFRDEAPQRGRPAARERIAALYVKRVKARQP